MYLAIHLPYANYLCIRNTIIFVLQTDETWGLSTTKFVWKKDKPLD